jgi:hypothetical protein
VLSHGMFRRCSTLDGVCVYRNCVDPDGILGRRRARSVGWGGELLGLGFGKSGRGASRVEAGMGSGGRRAEDETRIVLDNLTGLYPTCASQLVI